MLIFDKFPSAEQAEAFRVSVEQTEKVKGIVCLDDETFDEHEVYPFEVTFPAVLIDRSDMNTEARIIESVSKWGGEFSGT